ncbi:hypothetical protein [Paenibacillus sp. MMS20-IR301]|uniref:hypothetical protein n=1 Tax=Paenibacillus sp. MMS20-IR301 TaxID=2895946 RepID=UPI0028EC01D5|nr:hypothetical protein [Paenibacillus sp. MMS20-IR301]WNS40890.1 hypothetical protein LOS79_17725 [Paenibacillus sp. MMS20-IR301]
MAITNTVRDRLLTHTGFFEGDKGYSTVTGNFDNQGISFGIIQFNFGQGSLAPLLKEYITNNEAEFNSVFGASKAATLKNVVLNKTKAEQIAWGGSISSGGQVVTEWKGLFENMGAKSANQALQKTHAQSYIDRALSYATKFGIISTQGLAFLFDHAVQSWSFQNESSIVAEIAANERLWLQTGETGRYPDNQRLYSVLKGVTGSDPIARRTAIRNGSGTVHGKSYNISNFNLSYSANF